MEHFDRLEIGEGNSKGIILTKGEGKPSGKGKNICADPEMHIRRQGIVEHHRGYVYLEKGIRKSEIMVDANQWKANTHKLENKKVPIQLSPTHWPHIRGHTSSEDACEIRQDYSQLFTETRLEQKQGNYHIVVDPNTRLHARLQDESNLLGPHIFGRGIELVKKMPQSDKEQVFPSSVSRITRTQAYLILV